MRANAVELTAEAAWFLADVLGAGSFPWVLAITPPYSDLSQRASFEKDQTEQLSRMGVMSADRTVDTHVKTLRAKLRAAGASDDPIRTHRGLGYALEV